MEYRYFISNNTDPYKNLAIERSLLQFAYEKTAILYLWQNDNTIVIGRNQSLCSECRADEFAAQGGRIARRMSGGGAVYHDLGNLNFSIIKNQLDDQDEYYAIVLSVAKILGIEAELNGRNDVVCRGRKFSGNAVYNCGGKVCRHGTVLINTDIEKMTYYLTPQREKLRRHGVESVRSRVMNLSEIDPRITVENVMECFLKSSYAEPLKAELNEKLLKKYVRFFGSKKWIYGGKI